DTSNIYNIVSDLEILPDCILIDEAQFLSKKHVEQLSDIVDYLNVPVICYGLRCDFRQEFFIGSKHLLEIADKIEEIKTICKCGRKATANMRIVNGEVITNGEKVMIGGNESYVALCRKCYKKAVKDGYLVK
ncbi:MAG: thymidine kinase, partial [Clostridia bacterium]